MRTKQENINLIKKLSNANGISGFEDEVVEIALEELKTYDTSTDFINNLYVQLKGNKNNQGLKIWLDAHSDEIGFIIQGINPNGTMDFLPIGGWNPANVIGSKVRVRNIHGKYIPGIVAAKPVHFMSEAEKQSGIAFANMVIDVGATTARELTEVYEIRMGAPAVSDVTCSYNEEQDLFLGKAFDCRIGVCALLETLNQLQQQSVSNHVVATLSTQEEIGGRGIMTAVNNIKDADVAIIFEGCPADDTFTADHQVQTALRKGPMLRHFDCSMITNPKFMNYALNVAQKEGIPVQEAVRSGGGTNARFTHIAHKGIPTIVVGIPVRYAHNHYGFCTYEDYEQTIKFVSTLVLQMKKTDVEQFKVQIKQNGF